MVPSSPSDRQLRGSIPCINNYPAKKTKKRSMCIYSHARALMYVTIVNFFLPESNLSSTVVNMLKFVNYVDSVLIFVKNQVVPGPANLIVRTPPLLSYYWDQVAQLHLEKF